MMTFSAIFNILSYAIIGLIVCFCAYIILGMMRNEGVVKGLKRLKEIKDAKVNLLNAELSAFDLQILPKDEDCLDSGRLQSLKNQKLAGEFSLLSDELSNGNEIYRFIFKDNSIENGVFEVNIDEKLQQTNLYINAHQFVPNKFIRDEFNGISDKRVSALKHSYLENNNVEPVNGLAIASKNLSLKHTTKNKVVKTFKISKGDLLIPLMNVSKEFISYQVVDSSQNKRMRIGNSIKGGFFPVGQYKTVNDTYILCEDYLSAYTLYKSTGITSLVCFDIQNMFDVAKDLISDNESVELIFATSRDMLSLNKSRIKKGLYYSNIFNMPFIIPKFPDGDQFDHFKTWNELQRYESFEMIKHKVNSQIKYFKANGKKSTIRLASDRYGIEY